MCVGGCWGGGGLRSGLQSTTAPRQSRNLNSLQGSLVIGSVAFTELPVLSYMFDLSNFIFHLRILSSIILMGLVALQHNDY